MWYDFTMLRDNCKIIVTHFYRYWEARITAERCVSKVVFRRHVLAGALPVMTMHDVTTEDSRKKGMVQNTQEYEISLFG